MKICLYLKIARDERNIFHFPSSNLIQENAPYILIASFRTLRSSIYSLVSSATASYIQQRLMARAPSYKLPIVSAFYYESLQGVKQSEGVYRKASSTSL